MTNKLGNLELYELTDIKLIYVKKIIKRQIEIAKIRKSFGSAFSDIKDLEQKLKNIEEIQAERILLEGE